MDKYENIEHLLTAFKTSMFPDKFIVKEAAFSILFPHTLDEGKRAGAKGLVAYGADDPTKAEAVNLPEWLIFSWDKNIKQLSEEDKNNTVGSIVQTTFSLTDFSKNNPIDGKVDTGAGISSLHVDDYHIDRTNNRVTFTSSILSPNRITMPLDDSHIVRSADGGADPRPVVRLDVTVNGHEMKDMQFNLNDRSKMKHPVLIGNNILTQGKFLIDPTQESVEWKFINKPVEVPVKINIKEAYDVFENSNVTLGDLIKYMRTHVVENLQTVEY